MSPRRHKLSRYGWQPADQPRRQVLFVNPRSGEGTAARAGIAERARQSAIEVVMLTPGQSLPALARAAVANGADAVGPHDRNQQPGLLYTTHTALPHLLKAAEDGPREVADTVNISSIAGRVVNRPGISGDSVWWDRASG